MPCDYSKTVIYKIYCKDASINNVYVGHTTNFNSRQSVHQSKSNTDKGYGFKLYSIIKGNGGWDNYYMDIIEEYPCDDKIQAKQREQYWYQQLNANMNELLPYISAEDSKKKRINYQKKYFENNRDYYINYNKNYYAKFPEKKKEIALKYYNDNKEKICQKNKERRFDCVCGINIRHVDRSKHNKTKTHLKFLSTNSTKDNILSNNIIEDVPNEP
jgi:hypothetical protein